MVIVNAPLRADLFREKAESLGLVYVSKTLWESLVII